MTWPAWGLVLGVLACACACGQVDLTFVAAGEAGLPDASGDGSAACAGEAGGVNDDACVEPGPDATCDDACTTEDDADDDASFDAADDAPFDEGADAADADGDDAG